jgi:hypothetical protein
MMYLLEKVSLNAFWDLTGDLMCLPSRRETACEKRCCVDASDVRVCVLYRVACLDCDHEEQWNCWEWHCRCAC